MTKLEPNWKPGDELYVDGFPKYRIAAVIPGERLGSDVYDAVWQVEPMV